MTHKIFSTKIYIPTQISRAAHKALFFTLSSKASQFRDPRSRKKNLLPRYTKQIILIVTKLRLVSSKSFKSIIII